MDITRGLFKLSLSFLLLKSIRNAPISKKVHELMVIASFIEDHLGTIQKLIFKVNSKKAGISAIKMKFFLWVKQFMLMYSFEFFIEFKDSIKYFQWMLMNSLTCLKKQKK